MYKTMLDLRYGSTGNDYKEKGLALKLCLDVRKKLEPYEDKLKIYYLLQQFYIYFYRHKENYLF